MTPEDLLKPRYKVIADYPAYPRCPYNVGDIIKAYRNDNLYCDDNGPKMSQYPHLFRKLEWWEERTLDEILSVEYVKITEYTGYYLVGDVVNVTDYDIDTKNKQLKAYILNTTQKSKPERCIPATKEEFLAFKP